MIEFSVAPLAAGETLPREYELAWRLAEFACIRAPLDVDAVDMTANRLIDAIGVAVPALAQQTVVTGHAQASHYPKANGAALIGLPDSRVDCGWASWANGIAVRELDLHDNFYGHGVSHPADAIPALLAVAQHRGLSGKDLVHAILTAYEIQASLVTAIDLNSAGVDHVAHQAPALAAALGTLLKLEVETIYQAINHAAHVSCAPLQARKGAISNWKAAAPAHVSKLAVEAIDRAMRGQTNPAPIYEGHGGLLSTLMSGASSNVKVLLPETTEPRRAILLSYPKAYAAAYHAQAFIDLAFRMRAFVADVDDIESVVIHTKAYTHFYLGSGANDQSKYDPNASRETLDHSLMYIFAIALQDGRWHHERSYAPERAKRPDTVRLWQKIATTEDPEWSRRFKQPDPIHKDHGGRVVITLTDGTIITDEIAVPASHPRGARPFDRSDYVAKFSALSEGLITASSAHSFLNAAANLDGLRKDQLFALNVEAIDLADRLENAPRGLFS